MRSVKGSTTKPRPWVLVVDDDDDLRDSFRDVLEDEGYQVLTACNGYEALRTLHSEPPPAVILLDLMMPVMNGWQFRNAQKLYPRLASIPVVIVTAGLHGDTATHDLAAHRCLKKPVSVEDLLEAVQPFNMRS
jgi:CheY-like chemotaxis protein